ncbi:MAG TPA: Asp23/Gls24 family envelope stress response protein [Trueperaceae bacterium]|nr:Asp23/Gls24 family envelope stress response protein [Trueperaceae bacterium]
MEEGKAGQSASRATKRKGADREIDRVNVSDDALASILGLAAHEVPGVVGMAPANIGEGLRRVLGLSQVDEGVVIEHPHGEKRADVDIHVVVAYGVNIPAVADSVRERVKYASKRYAGIELDDVRVHVDGVSRG